jgi:hypothetical protein
MTIGRLLHRHPAIELVAIQAACPLGPHSRGKFCPIRKQRRVKRYTSELGGKSSFAPLKMSLFVLIVQLIVMSEDNRSGVTSERSNSLDELPNLNNNIRRKLMQLNPKLE